MLTGCVRRQLRLRGQTPGPGHFLVRPSNECASPFQGPAKQPALTSSFRSCLFTLTAPRLRSSAAAAVALPLNWSHLAHRARKPPTSSSPSRPPSHLPMGADLQLKPAQVRTHMGHSHGHGHHHHDNTYLTSTNKNDPGVKITRVGLYVNLGMAIGKGVGGYAFNSQA